MAKRKRQPAVKAEPLWTRPFLIILGISVFTYTASQMVTPLISKFALSLGAPLTLASTIASFMSLAALFFRPISGILSDRMNRKWIMIISTGIVTLSIGCYASSTNIPTLFTARVLHGIAFSFMGVSNMALGSDFVPTSRMGEGLGYLGLGNILAYAVGPSLGLEVSEKFGYPAVFGLAAALAGISVVAMFLIPNKPLTPQLKAEEASKKAERAFSLENFFAKDILLYVVILILFTSGNGLMNTYLAILGDERGISNVGLYFTAYSLVVLLVRPIAGKINDRFGLSAIMIPSFFLGATGMLCVAMARSTLPIVIAGALKAVSQGAAQPAIQAYSIRYLGKERAGVATSTCYIGQDLGNSIAPILGSFVVTNWSYTVLYSGYGAMLLVLGLGCYFAQRRLERKKLNPQIGKT